MVAERGLRCWLWVGRLAITLIFVNVLLATDAIGAGTRICVIDMGSNSFRRIVGSFDQGRYTQHAIEKRTLGVGDDVEKHGRISDPKLNEIRQALAGFSASCRKERITAVLAVGTAAFRDAANGTAVVTMATALGIQMEIATEKRESELAYLAGSLGQDGYAVIDNGSRSIELVAQEQRRASLSGLQPRLPCRLRALLRQRQRSIARHARICRSAAGRGYSGAIHERPKETGRRRVRRDDRRAVPPGRSRDES